MPSKSLLRELSWEFDEIPKLDIFDKVIFILWLFMFLLIFDNSADFDGWIKLIKRRDENITFFDIPEINLII